jgi:hypothetical protein
MDVSLMKVQGGMNIDEIPSIAFIQFGTDVIPADIS